MSITLITGRAITGKTGRLHNAVESAAKAGRPAVLLVPSFADVRRARSDLAARTPVGALVTTLDQWMVDLWSKYGDGRRIVTATLRAAVVQDIVMAESANPVASTRGFRELLCAAAARVSGADMVGARCSSPGDALFLRLLEQYSQACAERGLVEPGEALAILPERLPLQGALIAANRFMDFSPSQEAFLRGLGESNDVVIALTWEGGHPATEIVQPLVTRLRESGARHEHLESAAAAGELQQVEEKLFDPDKPIAPTGAVVFAEAAGEEAEAAVVARLVRECVDKGEAPENIAVVFKELAPRRHLVRAALGAENLQSVIDVALAFEHTPLGAAVLAVSDVVRGIGGRQRLAGFLASGFAGADSRSVEAFDASARKERLAGQRLLRAARELTGAGRMIGLAEEAVQAPWGETASKAWSRLAEAMLENAGRDLKRADTESALNAAAAEALTSAVAELADASAAAGDVGLDLTELLRGQRVTSGGQERKGCVYVTEAHRLRTRRFSRVVIGGLSSAEFSTDGREPLLVEILARMGLAVGSEDRLAGRLLFYSIVTRAVDGLVLVRCSTDSQGEAMRPSQFWEEMADLYRTPDEAAEGKPVEVAVRLPLSKLAQAAPAFAPGRRVLRERIANGHVQSFEPIRGALKRPLEIGPDHEFSVTELETYHACPYRWFYDRMVRPRELDASFDARERGAAVHELLAHFYRRFRERGHPRMEPSLLGSGIALLEKVEREYEAGARVELQGLEERLAWASTKRWAREALVLDATHLRGFEPAHFEWAFGREDARGFSLGGVSLRGYVDRIDVGCAGVIVTDYKSSSTVYDHSRFEPKGLLQAVVYSEAVSHLLASEPCGAFYRSLPTGQMRGFWNQDVVEPEAWACKDAIDRAEYEALVRWAESTVAEAASGIREGVITPTPARPDGCSWCGARGFCGGRLS